MKQSDTHNKKLHSISNVIPYILIIPSSSSEEELSSLYDNPFVPSVFNIQTLNPFFLCAMH